MPENADDPVIGTASTRDLQRVLVGVFTAMFPPTRLDGPGTVAFTELPGHVRDVVHERDQLRSAYQTLLRRFLPDEYEAWLERELRGDEFSAGGASTRKGEGVLDASTPSADRGAGAANTGAPSESVGARIKREGEQARRAILDRMATTRTTDDIRAQLDDAGQVWRDEFSAGGASTREGEGQAGPTEHRSPPAEVATPPAVHDIEQHAGYFCATHGFVLIDFCSCPDEDIVSLWTNERDDDQFVRVLNRYREFSAGGAVSVTVAGTTADHRGAGAANTGAPSTHDESVICLHCDVHRQPSDDPEQWEQAHGHAGHGPVESSTGGASTREGEGGDGHSSRVRPIPSNRGAGGANTGAPSEPAFAIDYHEAVVSYDPEAGAAYVAVRPHDRVARTESLHPHDLVMLDYDEEGRLLGVEVVGIESPTGGEATVGDDSSDGHIEFCPTCGTTVESSAGVGIGLTSSIGPPSTGAPGGPTPGALPVFTLEGDLVPEPEAEGVRQIARDLGVINDEVERLEQAREFLRRQGVGTCPACMGACVVRDRVCVLCGGVGRIESAGE